MTGGTTSALRDRLAAAVLDTHRQGFGIGTPGEIADALLPFIAAEVSAARAAALREAADELLGRLEAGRSDDRVWTSSWLRAKAEREAAK